MTDTQRKSAKRTSAAAKTSPAFTDEERDAMKERAKEVKAARRKGRSNADDESEVLAKIAEMADQDRVMAERVHAVIKATAPDLSPRLWYGMPAYAKDGKVVCFFQNSQKFKSRYSTLGFDDVANLDDGTMWPTTYALTQVTGAEEKRIAELVKRAVG